MCSEENINEKSMKELSALFSAEVQKLKAEKKSLIIVLEGLDASGKSGFARRLVQKCDMKTCRIIPVSKPSAEEYKYHYLHRFWLKLPEYGSCAIFDRSWYGRVLVERIEGFADEAEWRRAYGEINAFEKMLSDDGAVIVKLWFDVSPEEQLRRFKSRMEKPEKRHKITDEDWRNRSARDKYDEAMADMLNLTDSEYAPWCVIPSDDKKSARKRAACVVLSRLESEFSPAELGADRAKKFMEDNV